MAPACAGASLATVAAPRAHIFGAARSRGGGSGRGGCGGGSRQAVVARRAGRRRVGPTVVHASFLDALGLSTEDVGGVVERVAPAPALPPPPPQALSFSYAAMFPDFPGEVGGVSVPDSAMALADAASPAAAAAYAALPVGHARHRSPRHRMPFTSRKKSSNPLMT